MNPFESDEESRKPRSRTCRPKKSYDNAMSVGAIRYSFLQLRACKKLDTELVLWNGTKAGIFALEYLLSSSTMSKSKRRSCATTNKKNKLDENIEAEKGICTLSSEVTS